MGRKIFLILLVLFMITGISYAVNVDNKVSGDTVSFSTVDFSVGRGVRIVTFNSVTNHIKITNLSVLDDCYVDLRCIDSNGHRGESNINKSMVLVPALGRISPNTVEFDFATYNLGFCAKSGATGAYDRDSVHYVVTGEQGDL